MQLWRRRDLLATTAVALFGHAAARAEVVEGALPWTPDAADPPRRAVIGPWQVFDDVEGAAVDAIVDRLIPPDADTPGGKDAGCGIYIDRQLAGPYGHFGGHYRDGPYLKGTKQQGAQTETTPTEQYRKALAALDAHCRSTYSGKGFAQLPDDTKDAVIGGLEGGALTLPNGVDGQKFFELILKDAQEGFFADPLYGGNKDMAAWRMIGFPGARYDYRDWIDRHNEVVPLPPVSILGRPAWANTHKS